MSFESSSTVSGVSQLFQLLRDGVPRTRAELAKSTGLARSTIAARVDELMKMGLISPIAETVSTGGRPPSQFALNPSARLVLAADIGASHANVAVTDLAGSILVQHGESLDVTLGPEVVLTWLVENAAGLLQQIGRSTKDVAAIGMGVPGPVEHSTGQPVNPPIMPGWDRFDVPGWVQQHLDVPVLVDNDVNIIALGGRATAYPAVDHPTFVKVTTVICSGEISSGTLHPGGQSIDGGTGHVRVT